MIILWLSLLGVLAWKLPMLAIVLTLFHVLVSVLIWTFVKIDEKKRREKYFLVEFNQDALEKRYPKITKGNGIHIYRFMRDPKSVKTQRDNSLGLIEFDNSNKNFTFDLPQLGEFHEVLILDPETLSPVKIVPSISSLTISCDPHEFNATQIEKGKYLVWIRSLGQPSPIDNIFVSRDPNLTNVEEPLTIYSDLFTDPEKLKELAIECHHDNHNRMKIEEFQSQELDLFPRSPFIKACVVGAKVARDEIAFIFFENSRLRSLFHSLFINGVRHNIVLSENRSQVKLAVTHENAGETELDEVNIVYTQFLYDTTPSKGVAKPFITRYSKARSHFYESESEIEF